MLLRVAATTLLIAGINLAFACAKDTAQTARGFITEYLSATAATMHGESSEADIERVLEFYTDDVVYEHPRVGIRLEGKAAQRDGMTAFLPSYAGDPGDAVVEIVEFLEGEGATALSLNVRFKTRRDDRENSVERRQLRVIETRDGKISRVIDYW